MADILDDYPEYGSTGLLDDLRRSEYGYLDEQEHVYLDYTGSGLAARAQHRAHARRQADMVLGNPHSASPTSEAATQLLERTRARVLQHLHADADEYVAIFTPNATGAARLVGEAYRFHRGGRLVLTADNHNSVNGLREFARRAGTPTVYVPSTAPSLAVDQAVLDAALVPGLKRAGSRLSGWLASIRSCFGACEEEDEREELAETKTAEMADSTEHAHHSGLFAYPAQSNFSGVRHPLGWVAEAQARGYDVLLDAAAYLPTSTLDLSAIHPDFVLVSWYKLFGYPTGVGCLVARRAALARLDRPWFAGGSIRAVSVGLDWHAPARDVAARFEDGTVSFQAIPDVLAGLDWLADVVGPDRLQTRVRCLTAWFLRRLTALQHANGRPMAVLYGPGSSEAAATTTAARGPTVAFNLVDCNGQIVDERIVAADAAAARISLRTGCFCNPGAGETALGLSQHDLRVLQQLAIRSLEPVTSAAQRSTSTRSKNSTSTSTSSGTGGISEKHAQQWPPSAGEPPITGAVRVSFGVASNTADVDRFFAFVEATYCDRAVDSSQLGPRMEC
ncbi:molybdenum cofactor sulfurase [Grosmannia clavigera kw1407]|uniref:Molybdenum cofactor sulfurase n=1 Tax=Grosmannia clavigera (strain kw1407 / UAMH 11150) TaxID=655863 RepID=F0XIQ4_GROCL|nr:molybdenum cofactor sulfurase [Grosmannia clavigera kw1407]EFX02186.1 molybdenum cofactor sulfurase [Grosmannia clavigera kw1407]